MKQLLGKPRTIDQIIQHRKISWLELFYDLIFAVVVGRVTDALLEHVSAATIGHALVVLLWFYWNWQDTSGYFDNHGNGSLLNLLVIYGQMLLTGIAALFIPTAIEGHFGGLSWGLLGMTLLNVAAWFNVVHVDAVHARASRAWGGTYAVAAGLLLVTAVVPARYQLVGLLLAYVPIVADMFIAAPALAAEYAENDLPRGIRDSLLERFGLMTMIVLGETIAGLYTARLLPLTPYRLVLFILSVAVTGLLAAVYYQVIGDLTIVTKTVIAAMAIRWLFTVDLLLVTFTGIWLHQVIAVGTFPHRLAFVALLFASMFVMWLIQQCAHSFPEKAAFANTALFFLAELAVMLATAWLPVGWMLTVLAIVLLLLVARYVVRTA